MTENYENPPEFCPNCDPECEGDPTLFKLFSKIKPSFNLKGDGYYKGGKSIITRHPNIVKSVLIGKKGWGLWVDQWTEGIVDWTFTKEELLNEFVKVDIEIPESFLKDFENTIEKKKRIRNLKYLEELRKNEKSI